MRATNTIRKHREQRGFTQWDLADKMNCSPGSIQNYEGGIIYPPLDKARKIARILRSTVDKVWPEK